MKILFSNLLAVTAGAITALAIEPVRTQHASVEFLLEVQQPAPGHPFLVGVRIQLDPGWHTYWLNPGEAGMPTRVTWYFPDDFSVGPLRWPPPKRFISDEIVGFGYENEVVLLSEVTPASNLVAGSPINFGASVDFLVCGDICVPASAKVARSLVVANRPVWNEIEAKRLREALQQCPVPFAESELGARFVGTGIWFRVEGANWTGARPTFFPEARDILDVQAAPVWSEQGGGMECILPFSHLARGYPLRLRGVLVSEEHGAGRARYVDVRVRR